VVRAAGGGLHLHAIATAPAPDSRRYRRRVISAIDAYNAMLKDTVGPRMRELGFRGSGGVYTRPDPDYFIRVGFQKSVYGSRQHVKFTLNLSAISKAQWGHARTDRTNLPKEPAANTFYGLEHWQRRINLLMPAQERPPWWELTPQTDTPTLAREVLLAIERYALPAIDGVVGAAR